MKRRVARKEEMTDCRFDGKKKRSETSKIYFDHPLQVPARYFHGEHLRLAIRCSGINDWLTDLSPTVERHVRGSNLVGKGSNIQGRGEGEKKRKERRWHLVNHC